MKKVLIALCLVAFVSVSVIAQTETAAPGAAPAAGEKQAMTKIYSCSKCHMESKTAGKCSMCGEEMVARHIMKDKDGKTYICECAVDCPANCTLKEADKTQCTCGKPAKEAKFMKSDKEPAAGAAAKKPE